MMCLRCCPALTGQQEDEEDTGRGAEGTEGAGEDRQESAEEPKRPPLGRDQPVNAFMVDLGIARAQTECLGEAVNPLDQSHAIALNWMSAERGWISLGAKGGHLKSVEPAPHQTYLTLGQDQALSNEFHLILDVSNGKLCRTILEALHIDFFYT